MGTTLTGTTPQDTYDSLIKVTDNGPLSGTAKYLSDGLGNDSTLALSTGNIGIGTTTPTAFANYTVLSVNNATQGGIVELQSNGTSALRIAASTTDSALWEARNVPVLFASNNAERMRITAAGNVGIACTPEVPFEVHAGRTTNPPALGVKGGTAAFLYNDSANGSYGLLVGLAGANVYLQNQRTDSVASAYDLLLQPNGGNVGIGTSNPTGKLTVSQANSGGVAAILLTEDESTIQGPSANTYVKMGGNLTLGAAGVMPIQIATTEVLRVTANGLTFNGDTAAANALDDYEEGTWTMGVAFGGASVGVTYAANTGTYTKIGRQVTVNGLVLLTSKGSSTGAASITGLPFTVTDTNSNYSAASLRLALVTFANQFQAYGERNTTRIILQEITEAGAVDNLFDTDFANDSNIMVNFTYFV